MVRQLIAEGKSKSALDSAKEFHKQQRSAESEVLLLDAYLARVRSLLDQNMTAEARSLLDLVRERFPSATARLAGLTAAASARGAELADLLRPLVDPHLPPESRAEIERVILTQIVDLSAIAACTALPPEHSLRQAAGSLDRAFNLVTSGLVTDEQIALTEVSHRSPLASWKILIRAIACFYRDQDDQCREQLAAIKPGSVPSRLAPSLMAMLGLKPDRPFTPVETTLLSGTVVSPSDLQRALEELDRVLVYEHDPRPIFKAIREATRECQRVAPGQVAYLKQLVSTRGQAIQLDADRLNVALDGAPRQDAVFFRLYARTLERTHDPYDIPEACEMWNEFRQHAVRENWFAADSLEVSSIYLHMAAILEQVPPEVLKEVRTVGYGHPQASENRYSLDPEQLYQLACAIDPHQEAFSQWMRWAKEQSTKLGEKVAGRWRKLRPDDLEPVLYLMEQAEARDAFPTALSYLEDAERIDPVHTSVRSARLRLLAASAIRHLKQNKPHLAMEKIAVLAGLPQADHGNLSAFNIAVSHLALLDMGRKPEAAETLDKLVSLLGDKLAARLLLSAIAYPAKRGALAQLPTVKQLNAAERRSIPQGMTKVMAVTKEVGLEKMFLPAEYFTETEAQFSKVAKTLDVEQIRLLGNLGAGTGHFKLAWAASLAGLQKGGPSEAEFLLLRARVVPQEHTERSCALSAAAAVLGRLYGNTGVVDQAVRMARNPYTGEPVSLSLEQAREVVRRESNGVGAGSRQSPGPDYSDLLPEPDVCQCGTGAASRPILLTTTTTMMISTLATKTFLMIH